MKCFRVSATAWVFSVFAVFCMTLESLKAQQTPIVLVDSELRKYAGAYEIAPQKSLIITMQEGKLFGQPQCHTIRIGRYAKPVQYCVGKIAQSKRLEFNVAWASWVRGFGHSGFRALKAST